MKTIPLCLLGATLVWAADKPEIPARLSLADAVRIAFAQSTSIRAAAARFSQAEARAGQSRAPLLPQINANAYQSEQVNNLRALGLELPIIPPKVGPFPTVDARISATQDILNLASIARRRTASERVRGSQELEGNTREIVALSVATAYLQALRAQESVATLAGQLGLSRKLEQLTRDRVSQGVASRLELTRAEEQSKTLEQSLREGESALVSAKLQLANLMHARISSAYELSPVELDTDTAEQQAVKSALEARPDYRAALSQVKAAELQFNAVRATRLPVISFRGDWGISGRTPAESAFPTWRVQGGVSMPVFTGGRIAAEAAEARAQLDEVRANLDEIESQVETDVLTAIAQVQSARQQAGVAEQNVKLARQELELSTERLTSGVADNTEVVNAQDRLSRAEDSRVRAVHNLHLAQANLFRAMGAAEKNFRR